MPVSDFSRSRKAMIDSQLRTSGVSDGWLVAAMGSIAREEFVPDGAKDIAYMDCRIEIGAGRALNPPMATGLLLQEADVQANDKVLLIGAGSGYLAALLASRAEQVIAVEQDADLIKMMKNNLALVKNVEIVSGALGAGAADHAAYSLIVIDGAIQQLPEEIADQLQDAGRIVTGLADGAVTRLAMGVKRGGGVALRPFADCSILPLSGFERAAEFVF